MLGQVLEQGVVGGDPPGMDRAFGHGFGLTGAPGARSVVTDDAERAGAGGEGRVGVSEGFGGAEGGADAGLALELHH